jgi:hypothetical protein
MNNERNYLIKFIDGSIKSIKASEWEERGDLIFFYSVNHNEYSDLMSKKWNYMTNIAEVEIFSAFKDKVLWVEPEILYRK